MATTKKTKRRETTNKSTPDRSGKRRIPVGNERKLVNTLLKSMVDRLGEHKPTVGDVIRLLQFRRELEGAANVREIEVRWVEPSKTEDVSST